MLQLPTPFLVVFHPEGDEPRSEVTLAENEDKAWEQVADNFYKESGIEPDEEELYLDHVKSVEKMLLEAGVKQVNYEI